MYEHTQIALMLFSAVWLILTLFFMATFGDRAGALIDPDCEDPRVDGMRRFHDLLAAEPRVSATTIQTVGSKGYDGFTVALVTGEP